MKQSPAIRSTWMHVVSENVWAASVFLYDFLADSPVRELFRSACDATFGCSMYGPLCDAIHMPRMGYLPLLLVPPIHDYALRLEKS